LSSTIADPQASCKSGAECGEDVLPPSTNPSPPVDAGPNVDANPDGPVVPTEHTFTDPKNWTTFDLTPIDARLGGMRGAVFDGAYLYAVPYYYDSANGTGVTARYDVSMPFDAPASWTAFDATMVSARTKAFWGGAYDGRYVYYVSSNQYGQGGITARFDPHGTFTDKSAWATFDMTLLPGNPLLFRGAVFDGQYLYFIPESDPRNAAYVARYDTHLPLANLSSWLTFDASTIDPNFNELSGGAYDGRYVYFAPERLGIAGRYDTQAAFQSPTAWNTFDVAMILSGAVAFQGAAFDGRYVYFIPTDGSPNETVVVRYDTRTPFGAKASWSTFDVKAFGPKAGGFRGAVFDGRFVYLVPYGNATQLHVGLVVRYDTTSPFGNSSSWSTFDLEPLRALATGFAGGAYDGRYVYLIPAANSIVARFDARAARATPPPAASFF
jgi:hypothetical protein